MGTFMEATEAQLAKMLDLLDHYEFLHADLEFYTEWVRSDLSAVDAAVIIDDMRTVRKTPR